MALHRRRFLCLLGAGGAFGLAAQWHLLRERREALPPHPPAGATELQVVTRTSRALGAEVSLTVLHQDEQAAQTALTAAFAALERVEDLMSLYRPDSQLCCLNRDGRLENPHPWLVEVLEAGRQLSEKTEGAFDLSVQPLWTLYAKAKKTGVPPEPQQIERARRLVDWRRIDIAADRISLAPGMQLTANGIAQGFATDRAAAALRAQGIEHALVNAGEIGTLGGRGPDAPWKVGIQHPREPEAFISLARLEGRSLATSGDYATPLDAHRRLHHIFDPRTGLSPQEFSSVSIAAPTSMQADALSTAIFVLGLERGMEILESLPGVDAFFVLHDGRTLATRGFPQEA